MIKKFGSWKQCYTMNIIKTTNSFPCKNKVYGRLKKTGSNEWYYYCRTCYRWQIKENKLAWDKRQIIIMVKNYEY